MVDLYFETSTELYKAIEMELEKTAEEVKKSLELELKNTIDETVYARPAVETYERTRAMRDATDSKVSDTEGFGTEVNVFIDENKMRYTYPSQTGGSSDNRRFIVQWLNDGHRGFYNGVPVNYPAMKFFEKTAEKLKVIGVKLFTDVLNKNGVETK